MTEVRGEPARPALPDDARLLVDEDQPLIAIPMDEDGRRGVAYYTSDATADAALTDEAVQRAKALAGAWADLDWDEVAAELHRIRHEASPAPLADAALGAMLGDDSPQSLPEQGSTAT